MSMRDVGFELVEFREGNGETGFDATCFRVRGYDGIEGFQRKAAKVD